MKNEDFYERFSEKSVPKPEKCGQFSEKSILVFRFIYNYLSILAF